MNLTLTDLRIMALEHAMNTRTNSAEYSILADAEKYFKFLSADFVEYKGEPIAPPNTPFPQDDVPF